MNIGVYLAYSPNTPLGTEGLGRYLGGLLNGFISEGNDVTVVMPRWLTESMQELLEEFDIDSSNVRFVYNKKTPVVWGAYKYFTKPRKRKKRNLKYHIKFLKRNIKEIVIDTFSKTANLVLFLGICAVSATIMALFGIFCLIFGIVLSPWFFLKLIVKRSFSVVKDDLFRMLSVFEKILSSKGYFANICYQKMLEATKDNLIATANGIDVDVWFISTLFWNETKFLKAPRVNVVPDLVVEDYPNEFAKESALLEVINKCRDSVKSGENFITYCEYLNESVLKKRYGKMDGIAIPHMNNDLSRWINYKVTNRDYSEQFARHLLNNNLPKICICDNEFFDNFSFNDVHYIFYASQARPYKNIFGLIKAYEELLRIKNIKQKLILTCTPGTLKGEIQEYIKEHKLQFDVLFFPGVDIQTLAALYKCADLVVNPTLYEGGFPFTFGEGMSVGTPSVMGNIPQTSDVVRKYDDLSEFMLFDPKNIESMKERIEWALNNLDELYKKELPLYNELATRTSGVVAREYIDVFKKVIDKKTSA